MKYSTIFKFNHVILMIAALMPLTIMSCQSGKIPCPEAKYAKLRKSPGRSALVYTAKADQPAENNYGKPKTTRAVNNVTAEEWDCPRPGEKKYLPKSIKENIRKNYKKIKQQESNTSTTTSN